VECVVFIGIPATGKSTFYRERFFRTHVRINLDMLRTRHRERILLNACLEAKQPFVIDNTNPTRADRARYLQPALEAGFRVEGYYFQSRVQDALKRNARRPEAEQIPEVGIFGVSGMLELPTYQEGFNTLYYVSIKDGFYVELWNDE
jgi:predicted kinase